MKDILSNIIVLELASVLAGPAVGAFFAELGARVIKVENPGTQGDVTRKWKLPTEDPDDDISSYFSSINWGKESIAIDLRTEHGLEILYKLIRKTDIVLVNYKPGDEKKLKVDYDTLKEINPQIIYAHITGYGLDVPWAGYDAIIQAETGFTYMNGEPESPPTKMPVALMDILTAHQLKEAILLALLNRENTGKGSHVSASLFKSGVASLANQATNWLVGNKIPERLGSDHPNIVPYGTIFKTEDNKEIILAIGNDKQFQGLMKILESESTSDDPKFKSNINRVKNKEELKTILKKLIIKWKRNDLLKILRENDIPAGAVNNLQEVFEEPLSNELLILGKTKKGKDIKGIKTISFKFNNQPHSKEIKPPPHFGEHTEKIIEEFN